MPYGELLHQSRASPVLNVDETGWRTRGGKRTLWGALTARTALFRIAADRHQREAQALLRAEFSGIACSDRWSAYNYLAVERRQLCWAHLVRDFRAHSGDADVRACGRFGYRRRGSLEWWGLTGSSWQDSRPPSLTRPAVLQPVQAS